jgi:hypothetical protein
VTGVVGAGLASIAIIIGELSLYLAGSLLMVVATSATSMQALQSLRLYFVPLREFIVNT